MSDRFIGLYEDSLKTHWEKPALTDLEGHTYLYKDLAKRIKEAHILFESAGIKPGDKIAICGKNSTHWAISFFSTVTYGAVVVTILQDFHTDGIRDIVNHSDAVALFADATIINKIKPADIPTVQTIIRIEDFSITTSFNEELFEIRKNIDEIFDKKYPSGLQPDKLDFYQESPDEMAILNYTSGTMSSPKGVMLSYRSLWSNTKYAIENLTFIDSGANIICMLPMAHMYGLAFELLLSIASGSHISFLNRVPSPQILVNAFEKVKPSLVLAVPLIIEKIVRGRVFPELEQQPVKTLIKLPVLRNIVYKKIRGKLIQIFGGEVQEIIIGGAALSKDVGDFLHKIRFPYTVGYGMTECGPLISYVYWEQFKAGCCGRVVDRLEVKIDSEDPQNVIGEILVRGDNVTLGYYKNQDATKQVFTEDGWLRTGDLATIDKDGFIFIKGRSKSMILTANGQNIYPEEVEEKFNCEKYVLESLVVERNGNGNLVVMIVPDVELLQQEQIDKAQWPDLFGSILDSINKQLPKYSKVSDFELRETEFEKTPKRSIRRFLYK